MVLKPSPSIGEQFIVIFSKFAINVSLIFYCYFTQLVQKYGSHNIFNQQMRTRELTAKSEVRNWEHRVLQLLNSGY